MQGRRIEGARVDTSKVRIGDSVTCSCTTCYEALSYAWGEAAFPNHIELNRSNTVPITKSLYTALQYLRFTESTRSLWIDALCINQNDVEERSAQVAMMVSIYFLAHSVVIWLGPSSTLDPLTVLFTEHQSTLWDGPYYENMEELVVGFGNDFPGVLTCPCCDSKFPNPADPLDSALEGLCRLFESTWFQRLWVIQEVVVARRAVVHLGNHVIDWKCLKNMMSQVGTFASQHPKIVA